MADVLVLKDPLRPLNNAELPELLGEATDILDNTVNMTTIGPCRPLISLWPRTTDPMSDFNLSLQYLARASFDKLFLVEPTVLEVKPCHFESHILLVISEAAVAVMDRVPPVNVKMSTTERSHRQAFLKAVRMEWSPISNLEGSALTNDNMKIFSHRVHEYSVSEGQEEDRQLKGYYSWRSPTFTSDKKRSAKKRVFQHVLDQLRLWMLQFSDSKDMTKLYYDVAKGYKERLTPEEITNTVWYLGKLPGLRGTKNRLPGPIRRTNALAPWFTPPCQGKCWATMEGACVRTDNLCAVDMQLTPHEQEMVHQFVNVYRSQFSSHYHETFRRKLSLTEDPQVPRTSVSDFGAPYGPHMFHTPQPLFPIPGQRGPLLSQPNGPYLNGLEGYWDNTIMRPFANMVHQYHEDMRVPITTNPLFRGRPGLR